MFIGKSLDIYGEYCENEFLIMDLLMQPNFIVLDIGANLGLHTVWFSKHAFTGKVHSFEPVEFNRQLLHRNLNQNRCKNVQVYSNAVSNRLGNSFISVFDPTEPGNYGECSLIEGHAKSNYQAVPTVPIDKLPFTRVDFIKIDVEGYEPQVLAGALNDVMVSSLYRADIDSNELNKGDIATLTGAVFHYTLKDGDLNTGFYLRPHANEEYLCNAAITLAANTASTLRHSLSNSLKYLFMGLGSVSLYDKLHQHEMKSGKDNLTEQFIDYMAIGRHESFKNWAAHAPGALNPVVIDTVSNVFPGLIRLNAQTPGGTGTYYKPTKDEDPKDKGGYSVFTADDEKGLAQLAASAAFTKIVVKHNLRFITHAYLLIEISYFAISPCCLRQKK